MITRAARYGLILLATIALLTGCGGGGGGGGGGNESPNEPDNPVVTVTVTPSAVTVVPGGTRTFTASVTGSVNRTVTWSASVGTITQGGVYTAPAGTGTYTVRATSVADPAKSSVATVTVQNGAGQAVAITPPNATLNVGATQQFNATATGFGNNGIAYSATGGTVSATGLYTAPGVPGMYVVRATSVENPSFGAEARVTVTGAFSLSPGNSTIGTNETIQFTTQFPGGAAAPVNWTATAGTISATGLYRAPANSATATVTASLQSDPTQRRSATITVVPIAVTITPTSATVARGETFDFDATVTGANGSSAVTWTASQGTITSAGLFTAPNPGTGSTVTITAKSVADPSKSASATVTLTSALPNVAVTVSPTGIQVAPGGAYDFDATVTGSTNTAVVWSTTTGQIDANGVLTAGASTGTFEVRATSVSNPNRSSAVTVKVDAIPVNVTPRSATLRNGASVQFAATVGGAGSSGGVTWTASGGSIDATGRYTATAIGTFTITATSVTDPTRSNTATVTVTAS